MKANNKKAALLLAGAILIASPIGAGRFGADHAAAAPAQAQAAKTSLSQVDAAIIKKAQAYVKQVSGLDITFTDVLDTPQLKRLTLVVKDAVNHETVRVAVDSVTGELQNFYVETVYNQLDSGLKKQLNEAMKELPGNAPTSFESIHHAGNSLDYVTTMLEAGEYAGGVYGKDMWVRFINKQLETINLNVMPVSINSKVLEAAKQSLNVLGYKSPAPTAARYVKSYGSYKVETYKLAYGEEAEAEVGAATKTVYSLAVYSQQSALPNSKTKPLSNAQLLKLASTPAKQLYGLDLKNYTVSKKTASVVFTKKGAPTLVCTFTPSGVLSSIAIELINDVMN